MDTIACRERGGGGGGGGEAVEKDLRGFGMGGGRGRAGG